MGMMAHNNLLVVDALSSSVHTLEKASKGVKRRVRDTLRYLCIHRHQSVDIHQLIFSLPFALSLPPPGPLFGVYLG
jgi:hypothetical protein